MLAGCLLVWINCIHTFLVLCQNCNAETFVAECVANERLDQVMMSEWKHTSSYSVVWATRFFPFLLECSYNVSVCSRRSILWKGSFLCCILWVTGWTVVRKFVLCTFTTECRIRKMNWDVALYLGLFSISECS